MCPSRREQVSGAITPVLDAGVGVKHRIPAAASGVERGAVASHLEPIHATSWGERGARQV